MNTDIIKNDYQLMTYAYVTTDPQMLEYYQEAARVTEEAIKAAAGTKTIPQHTFSGPVEHAIAHIEEAVVHSMPEEQQRWYAIKVFERDDKVLEQLNIPKETMDHIEKDIQAML